jgi:hypothetical protein
MRLPLNHFAPLPLHHPKRTSRRHMRQTRKRTRRRKRPFGTSSSAGSHPCLSAPSVRVLGTHAIFFRDVEPRAASATMVLTYTGRVCSLYMYLAFFMCLRAHLIVVTRLPSCLRGPVRYSSPAYIPHQSAYSALAHAKCDLLAYNDHFEACDASNLAVGTC